VINLHNLNLGTAVFLNVSVMQEHILQSDTLANIYLCWSTLSNECSLRLQHIYQNIGPIF